MKQMDIKYLDISEIVPYENNPRHNDNAVEAVAASIREFGFKVPIVIDQNNVIITGHTRLKAANMLGLEKVPCITASDLTDEQIKAFRLADNKVGEIAEWDYGKLEVELSDIDLDMEPFGFDDIEIDTGNFKDLYPDGQAGALAERFIVPPFSVLDARAGEWQERKRAWKEAIGDSGERGDAALFEGITAAIAGNSILDPALCEVVLHWFTPAEGCNVFDCFAGDPSMGYVAAAKGHTFTGIELREEQCEDNRAIIARDILDGHAVYVCDDGQNVHKHIEQESQDLFFSCPPYYDLEVYSDLENDASNQETYEDFYKILGNAFKRSIKCLKDNRFAVVVAGDVRDKHGAYYNFIGDIKKTFMDNGLALLNELILVDPVGTAMLRAGRQMNQRKVVKVHQNVLVFYKGDPRKVGEHFAPVEVGGEVEE